MRFIDLRNSPDKRTGSITISLDMSKNEVEDKNED